MLRNRHHHGCWPVGASRICHARRRLRAGSQGW